MISSGNFDMSGEGMHELGPENMSGPSDQDIVLQAANQFLGDERYPKHNERMLQLLEKYDFSTPGMEMATALHDIVDHGLINPEDGLKNLRARELVGNLYGRIEDKESFIYALGCAISTAYWEGEVGEVWRFAGPEAFSGKTIGERQQITAAIERNPDVEIDEAVLKSARPDEIQIDTAAFRHAMQERDVEGLIIKAVELLDNLDNPPPNNPASTWRDCVEIIKCYAPALELFGFNNLANDLRGKALEYFYGEDEETVQKALNQHELSVKYFDFAVDAAESVIREVLRETSEEDSLFKNSKLLERVKSYGSMLEKFHDHNYVTADLVPDGIGIRLILPDGVTAKQIIEIGEKISTLFTESWMEDGPETEFLAKHPVDPDPVDESITEPREKSEYSAYHLALQYRAIEDGTVVSVPVEIQLVTEAQERLHTYNKASHVLYKSGTSINPNTIKDLEQIELRAEHLRNKPLNQELNPHTWVSILQQAPELDTPIHRAYSIIEIDGGRVMVPHELAGLDPTVFEDEGLKGDIILPPSSLDEASFFDLISLIDPSIRNSEQIKNAIDLLKQQDLEPRRNSKSALKGHLLPTAFHAGVMAALSSKHWENQNPSEYIETVIMKALLHDIIEDTELSESSIDARFGEDVARSVYALTSPGIIKNEHLRRTIYAWKIESNKDAPFIKLPDRGQNITTDLVLLSMAKVSSEREKKRVSDYVKKTERYLAPIFENQQQMPQEYINVYTALKAINKKLLVS